MMSALDPNILIPCLMYHSLSDKTGKDIYTVSLNDFNDQMEFLAREGYRAVTVVDYLNLSHQDDVSIRYVLITFDDGTKSDYDLALPILKKNNYKATFFIIAGRIGQTNRLSWEELREMKDAGMSIQSHTFSHRILSDLSSEEISYELAESKKILEERLGIIVNHLSLPLGFSNDAVKSAAKQIGYQAIWTSRFGVNRIGDNLLSLKRSVVKRGMTLKTFEHYLSPSFFLTQKELLPQIFRGFFKKVLGIDRYERLIKLLFERGR